jgi:hypothetical protein
MRNFRVGRLSIKKIVLHRKEEKRFKSINDMLHYSKVVFLFFRLGKGSET